MPGYKVHWSQFDPNSLVVNSPVAKKAIEKETGKEITYNEIPLLYRYTIPNPAIPLIDDPANKGKKIPDPIWQAAKIGVQTIFDPAIPGKKILDQNWLAAHTEIPQIESATHPGQRELDPNWLAGFFPHLHSQKPGVEPLPAGGMALNVQVVSDLQIELPPVQAPRGIASSKKDGYWKHVLWCIFQLANADTKKFLARNDRAGANALDLSIQNGPVQLLWLAMIAIVFQHKGAVGLAEKEEERDIRSLAKYPVYWPRDKVTSKVIDDKDPSQFFPLHYYEKGGYVSKAAFYTAAGGDPLDWEMLTNVEMILIPLWRVKRIYVGGGKVSLQSDIGSAVVTDIKPANTDSNQEDTIANLTGDVELQDKLKSQLEALKITFAAAKVENERKAAEAAALAPQGQSASAPSLPMPPAQGLPMPPQNALPSPPPAQQQYQQIPGPPAQQYQQIPGPPAQQYQQQMPSMPMPVQQQYQQQYQPQQQMPSMPMPTAQYQQQMPTGYPAQSSMPPADYPQTPSMSGMSSSQQMPANPLAAVLNSAPTMTGFPSMGAMPVLQ